jgi:hypothetical protein
VIPLWKQQATPLAGPPGSSLPLTRQLPVYLEALASVDNSAGKEKTRVTAAGMS